MDVQTAAAAGQKQPVQLDLYCPTLSLAFEYAGRGHFEDFLSVSSVDQQRATDADKAAYCAQRGIQLIEIPYWWDGSVDYVKRAILSVRPDIALRSIQHHSGEHSEIEATSNLI